MQGKYKNYLNATVSCYKCLYKVLKARLTGPDFVWVLPGWYRTGWWNVSNIDCTAEEMKNALEHSLTNSANPLISTNMSRVIESGKVEVVSNDIWPLLLYILCIRMCHSFKVI